MNKQHSVSLDEHLTGFVDEQVRRGHYGDASDVVRAGLYMLEEHEANLAALRTALIEGEESGISEPTILDIWAAVKAEQPHG